MSTGLASPAQFKRVRMLQRKLAKPAPWECPDAVTLAEQAGITLDDWQARACLATSKRVAFLCSRQSGKSLCAALIGLHAILARPNETCLITAPSLRQSSELARSAKSLYAKLGRPVRAVSESVLSLSLANNSRLVSLPGTPDTSRGFTPTIVIVDEAARVSDEAYVSIIGMLAASNGRLITLSTPAGCRGWWHSAWVSDEPWERFSITAEQCPRITKDFLERAKASIGQFFFDQEFLCVWQESETWAFKSADIERIIKPEVTIWDI